MIQLHYSNIKRFSKALYGTKTAKEKSVLKFNIKNTKVTQHASWTDSC